MKQKNNPKDTNWFYLDMAGKEIQNKKYRYKNQATFGTK